MRKKEMKVAISPSAGDCSQEAAIAAQPAAPGKCPPIASPAT